VVDVVRGFETTSFLAITNPLISIEGGRGADTLRVRYPNGGAGLPSIKFDGGSGFDRVFVYGGDGDDIINLVQQGAFAASIPGNMIMLANVESLTIWAGAGDDTVDASGLKTIRATIYGEAGDDHLVGGQASDTIYGGWGNDRIAGNGGNDALFGQWGDDILFGGPGRNRLVGGPGFDTISELAEWLTLAKRR
jgi:Ca2+-binding RTX toxin-like protein